MNWTAETLIAFEERIRDAFLAKRIHAPIHLSGNNESQLIEIFQDVRPQDWVFSTWRSHYHALLKGIPEEWIFAEILAGRSMYLMNADHKFLCSAIVGGILPIAAGIAMGIKRREGHVTTSNSRTSHPSCVWVFVGDMTARSGLFHEFLSYCDGQRLPVHVVIEDNGMSTDTPTKEAWGSSVDFLAKNVPVTHYWYERVYPHVGLLQFVDF